jgi:O-antigen/teichoic acid export membrane protein
MERPGRPPARADDPERTEDPGQTQDAGWTGRAEPGGGDHWVPDRVTPVGRPPEVRWTQRRPDRDWQRPAQGGWAEPGRSRDGRPHEGVDLLLGQLQSGFMGSVTQTIDLSMLHRLLADEQVRRDLAGRAGGAPSGWVPDPGDPEATQALRLRPRPGDRDGSRPDPEGTQAFVRNRPGEDPRRARTDAEGTQLLRRDGRPARPPEQPGPDADGTQLLRRPPSHRHRPDRSGYEDAGRREPLLRDLDEADPPRGPAPAAWARDEAASSPAKGTPRGRALWTLADQLISSGTNSVLMFVVAREVSKVDFGAFSVAFAVFAVIIGFSKAAGAQPLSIRYSGAPEAVFARAAARATGAALLLGVIAGAGCALAGAAIGGLTGSALVTLGLVLPGLLVQDQWRQVFFAQGRPAAAAANDGVWAVVQLIGVTLLLARHVTLAAPMLLAWGASAAVAALIGVAQAGFWPAPGRALDWVREHRDINGYLALEFITIQGALNASLLIIGVIGAVELVGALRGVQTLLGPTTVLAMGLISWAIPEFSRRTDMTAAARMRAAYLLSAAVASVGIVWGLGFLFLGTVRVGGHQLGQTLLGDTWSQTHHLLALSILQQAGAASTVGVSCMLIALGRAKNTFRLNVIAAPQLLLYPVIGVALGGGTGAVLGFTVANWIMLPFWVRMLRDAAKEAERASKAARRGRGDRPSGPGERRDQRAGPVRQPAARRGAPATKNLSVE